MIGFRRQLVLLVAAGLAAGCSGGGHRAGPADLRAYLTAVEKVRLPVNSLLDQADPILAAYRGHRITPAVASARMGALERTFARYLLAMQQIVPGDGTLRGINTPYAHTYYLEDNYLATLASDLADGDFDNLPDTQTAQRLAIVIWRTQLQALAAQLHVSLPADIAQAGRGEIAPAP